jgi:translation initiation factor 6 (eIF-6)
MMREDFRVAKPVVAMADCSGVMRVMTEARTVEKGEGVAGMVAGMVAVKAGALVGAASAEVGLAVVEQGAEG